jgi:hypothetical protein
MTAWTGIEAGDIGFDQGGGIVGFLIRHFSHSPYAHCWVYHTRLPHSWITAEAYPGGLKLRERQVDDVHRVARVWRDESERLALLKKSEELIGRKYRYRELFRIIHYRIRQAIIWFGVAALLLALLGNWRDSPVAMWSAGALLVAMLYAVIPLKTELNDAVICSNHVAQSVLAARPELELTYPPQSIWPGRLERDLNLITWHDWLEGK